MKTACRLCFAAVDYKGIKLFPIDIDMNISFNLFVYDKHICS